MVSPISSGDPVVLKNAKGLKKYGLHKGMKGFCNSVQVLPPDEEYVSFMPDGVKKIFVINADRFIIDKDRQIQLEAEKQEDTPKLKGGGY